jgi:glycosyltransferase involved in cell wall biosynthesis
VRVVFLTHNYPRHAGDLAGAFLHPLARALQARGDAVRVVAPSDQGRGGEAPLEGIPVTRVRYGSAARERYAYSGTMQHAIRSPAGLLAIARLMRGMRAGARRAAEGEGPAVIHAHWWVPAGLAAPPELPMVLTLHGTDAMLLARSPIARRMAAPVLRRARVVTTVSTALAQIVASASGRELAAIKVQPMPVDSSSWGWSIGGGGVLVVSRLIPQKRVHLALEAAAILRPSVLVTIVGDGPARPALERLASSLGISDRTRFVGARPFEDVLQLLMRADMALVPAAGEGFGLVAAEALMAGVPVVACRDGGGLLDIVPERGGGRIVEPAAEPIAAALRELRDDRDACGSARASGALWRRQLAPAAVASQFSAWYREAAIA